MEPENTTLFCQNDTPENRIILDKARALGLDVRKVKSGTVGTGPGLEPEKAFHDLRKNVMLIQMADPALEALWTLQDRRVVHLDQYVYYRAGKRLDRSHGLSALERFAFLFDSPLKDVSEKSAACFDHGFVRSRAGEMGCTHEDLKALLETMGFTDEVFEASKRDYDARVEFDDFYLAVTELEDPSFLALLHQMPEEGNGSARPQGMEKGLLILTVKKDPSGKPASMESSPEEALSEDPKRVAGVYFYGPERFRDRFADLSQSGGIDSEDYQILEGGEPGRGFFWIGKNNKAKGGTDGLADAVLNEIVGQDRPLLKYSTVFFYPFKHENGSAKFSVGKGKWRPAEFNVDKKEYYQEYIYFHQFVRMFLYRTDRTQAGMDAIRYYEFGSDVPDADTHFSITYTKGGQEQTLSYPVRHIGMHRFYNDISILAIQVVQEVDKEISEKPLWGQCFHMDHFRQRGLTCREALLFNNLARRIYLSYEKQIEKEEIPNTIELSYTGLELLHHCFCKADFDFDDKGQPIKSKIINELVGWYLGDKNAYFEGLLDDRMVVYTFLGLAGDLPRSKAARREHDVFFSRALYVDFMNKEYYYDEAFTKKMMRPLVYRRWYNVGAMYGFTRYSSVYTGFGQSFGNKVFQDFNAMYYQMALVALYYRVFLIDFSKQVADDTTVLIKDRPKVRRKRFIDLKESFMRFSNIYWFKEVTNQDQGVELFDLYKESFRFHEMYEQIKEEIDRADEYLAIRQDDRINNFNTKFAIGGVILAVMAILTGFFGMNFTRIAHADGCLNTNGWFLFVLSFLGVALIVFLFVLVLLRRPLTERREDRRE